MRHQDVDQLRCHLVDVQLAADSPHRAVQHRVPHHRRVQEPLLQRRRDAHDDLGDQLRDRPTDRLHRDHRVGSRAARGPDRQHRRALAVRAGAVDQALQRRPACASGPASSLPRSVPSSAAGSSQSTSAASAVVLPDPARLVNAERERSRRGIRHERGDLGRRRGFHRGAPFGCAGRRLFFLLWSSFMQVEGEDQTASPADRGHCVRKPRRQVRGEFAWPQPGRAS